MDFTIDTSIPLKQALRKVFKAGSVEVSFIESPNPWWCVRQRPGPIAPICNYYGRIPKSSEAQVAHIWVTGYGLRHDGGDFRW